MKPSNKYFDAEKSFMDADKRVSRERAFREIEEGRVRRLKDITAYRTFLETWDEKQKMLEMLTKQISTLTADIPYTMQDYFGIRRKYY